MKLYAVAKDKYGDKNQGYVLIEREYPTKKSFSDDLKSNGYVVRKIYTENEWKNL